MKTQLFLRLEFPSTLSQDKFENDVFVAKRDKMFSVHIIVFDEIATEIIWMLSRKRYQKVPFSLSTLSHLASVFKFIHFTLCSAFSKSSVFGPRKFRFSVDESPIRIKKSCVFKLIRLSVNVALNCSK